MSNKLILVMKLSYLPSPGNDPFASAPNIRIVNACNDAAKNCTVVPLIEMSLGVFSSQVPDEGLAHLLRLYLADLVCLLTGVSAVLWSCYTSAEFTSAR